MTSHELAHALLAGPDAPVELHVGDPHDTYVGDPGDCGVRVGTLDTESARARGLPAGPVVVLHGWMSSEDGLDGEDD